LKFRHKKLRIKSTVNLTPYFERLADGSIKSRTPLGLWMWKNLALSNPSHRIHWMLEELKTELKRLNSMEIDDIEILKKIQKLNSELTYPNFG
jgi:hypothetical protein